MLGPLFQEPAASRRTHRTHTVIRTRTQNSLSSKRFITVTIGFIWQLSDTTQAQIDHTLEILEISWGKRWPISIHLDQLQQHNLSIRRAPQKQGIFANAWTVSAGDGWITTCNFINNEIDGMTKERLHAYTYANMDKHRCRDSAGARGPGPAGPTTGALRRAAALCGRKDWKWIAVLVLWKLGATGAVTFIYCWAGLCDLQTCPSMWRDTLLSLWLLSYHMGSDLFRVAGWI